MLIRVAQAFTLHPPYTDEADVGCRARFFRQSGIRNPEVLAFTLHPTYTGGSKADVGCRERAFWRNDLPIRVGLAFTLHPTYAYAGEIKADS